MSFENIQRSILPAKTNSLAPRQGLVFDGTNGATIANVPAFGTADFTAAAWVNASNLSEYKWLFYGATNAFGLFFNTDGTFACSKVGVGDGSNSTGAIVTGKTYLVTYVRSGGTSGTYYLNGIAAGTTNDTRDYTVGTSTISTNSSHLFIGYASPLIYNRALSAAEVLSLYESGAPSGNDLPGTAAGTAIASSAGVNAGNVLTSFTSSSGQWQGTVAVSTAPYVRYSTGQINVGNKFKVSGTVAFSGGTLDYFGVTQQGSGTGAGSLPTSNGNFNVTFTAHSYQASGLIDFFFAGNGVTVTVTNLVITPLGLLLAPDSNQPGGGLVWYDTSGNGANITLPSSGVRWNVPSSRVLGGDWTTSGNLTVSGTNYNYVGGNKFFRGFTNYNVLYTGATELSINNQTDGANLASFRNNGSVLIGTASPSNYGGTLQLKGRQAWLPSTWTNASTDYLAWMNVDDSTNTFYIQTLQNNGTNGGSVSMQPNGGNVLIGTTTDYGGKLNVYKGNGGNANGAANAAIYLPVDESSIQGPGTNTVIRMGGNLFLSGNNVLQLASGGTLALTIDSSQNAKFEGKLGIATTPSYPLHVVTSTVSGRQTLTNIDKTTANWVRITNPEYSVISSVGVLLRVFPDSDARQGAGMLASGGTAGNGTTDLSLFASTGISSSTTHAFYNYSGGNGTHSWFTDTSGTTRMTLDVNGNIGLNVSPNSWGSSNMRALQISGPGSAITSALYSAGETNGFGLVSNAYYDGSNWKYIYSGGNFNATRYQLDTGIHEWYTSAAGASGNNVTWTKAMQLDTSSTLTILRSVSATVSPDYFVGINLYNQSDGGCRILGSNAVSSNLAAIDLTVTSSGSGTDDGVIKFHTSYNGSMALALTLDAIQNATFTGTIVSNNGQITSQKGSGNDVSLTLNQVGVAAWTFKNNATNGTLTIGNGAADPITIAAGASPTVQVANNLTAGGNLTVSGGTITGGSSGLSLAAGGTNQNVNITPSGTGVITSSQSNQNARIDIIKNTAPALNHIAQIVFCQGVGGGFAANDRSWQAGSLGASSTAADFFLQYWNGSSYAQYLTLKANGNLLVGSTTDSSLAKLQVAGGLHLNASDPTMTWNSNTLILRSSTDSIGVVSLRRNITSPYYNPRFEIQNSANTVTVDIDGSGDARLSGNLNLASDAPNADVTAWGSTPKFYAFTSGTEVSLISLKGRNGTSGADIGLLKSRATDGTANTAVQNGDELGNIYFAGADGASFVGSASIRAKAVGTIASTRVGGQLEFYTSTDAAPSVSTLALTIDNAQNATFAGRVKAGTAYGTAKSVEVNEAFINQTQNTTKTVTVGLPGGATGATFILDVGAYGNSGTGYGSLLIKGAGYLGSSTTYDAYEVVKVNSGNVTVSSVTKGNGQLTFTVINTSGTVSISIKLTATAGDDITTIPAITIA